MFNKKYEDRLRCWNEFRSHLETIEDPIQETIDLYNLCPLVSIQVDPYDQDTWLDPWQLLYENTYCKFAVILGIAYTLQLTERFSQTPFEIHICTDKTNSEVKYLLYVANKVIGYNRTRAVDTSELSTTITIEKIYQLPTLQ
jgi:hypothetical protein